jgi:hypothetical protein
VQGDRWSLRNSNSSGMPDVAFDLGTDGRPTVGDWDGDGVDTPGVVRKGIWQVVPRRQQPIRTRCRAGRSGVLLRPFRRSHARLGRTRPDVMILCPLPAARFGVQGDGAVDYSTIL